MSSDPAEGSSLHQALLSLQEAEKKLNSIVNIKFDQAVETGNLPEAMRFFKIFPLLNLHEIGLKKFCKHLCLQINDHGDKTLKKTLETPFNHKRYPVLFSDHLTNLYEYIADIVETYQPLVETYYGKILSQGEIHSIKYVFQVMGNYLILYRCFKKRVIHRWNER